MSSTEQQVKAQVRRAMDVHIASGNGTDSATWRKVLELDARLQAMRSDTEQQAAYRGPTCSHPHNLPYNDECAVWWLRKPETIETWRQAHTNLQAKQA
jgi:hypothetical protein